MASRPGVWELFTLISNFLNLWILKSLKVIGSSSEILLLKGVSFSKLNVFDFKYTADSWSAETILKAFLHCLLLSIIISKFYLSGLLVGWKGKKWSKMTKNSVCHTPYIRKRTSYDCDFCYTHVKWWHLQAL